ncbi:uncharacterized protein LOC107822478 isoform X4 [Nicotiana tabacum]|uniref:Uncharacterized protein LOC107822478 isoform X4 n=2 Tax=Nicotiana TaxID=4085 RepID=A0A1S4CTS3_TOBAC|nr:PREDICTED: uncharacterized protein LOC104221052 isoform X2 [Nicotiana sylvestris]XP_016504511.1 PREDICTED: uncharacterized protein LOC107822478 isoform X2 [Nicotiana tabacum]
MACPSVEIPFFADTNLGTRIVVAVSPHTTANGFKRELERAHLNCFPQLGQIKADAVMVKRNSCFYRLPETLPLKHVFQHLKGIRSLHVEVCQYGILYQLGSSEYVDDQILDQHDDVISTISGHTKIRTSMTGTKFEKLKCRRKMKKMKRFACLKSALLDVLRIAHLTKMKKKKRNKARKRYKFNCLEGPDEHVVVSKASFALPTYCCEGRGDTEQSFCPATESHCEDLSETVSVSGIIRKYFSSHDEVNSSLRYSHEGACTLQGEQTRTGTYLRDLNVELALLSSFPAKTPPQISDSPLPNASVSRASINKSKRIEIGSRIISASKSHSSVRCRRLLPKSASLIRSLVFEMSDED